MKSLLTQKMPVVLPEFVTASTGVADAGKAIKLDSAGKLGVTLIDPSVISHGTLSNLNQDDHVMYSRVDGTRDFTAIVQYNLAKVFTDPLDIVDKAYVDSLLLAIDVTTGITDAGKNIKTDATGYLDGSFIVQTDIDHGSISGLSHDDHTIYSKADGTRDFTAIVQYDAAKTFTTDLDIVDKKYVDDSIPTAISATTGISDASKFIETDVTGYLDSSFIVQSDVSHSSISDLDHDDHTQYSLASGSRAYTNVVSYAASNSFSSPLNIPDVAYVDSKAQGLKPNYDEIRIATPEDLSTYTYNNGTLGVGAYLKAPDSSSAYNTHDSILLTSLNRVLVYDDQNNASETTNVTCVADVAGSLNNKYFWLYSKTKSYYAWYNVSAGGVDPNPAIPAGGPTTKRGVAIAIVTGDADTVVCAKSQLILNAVPDFNVSGLGAAVLQIQGVNFSGESKNISAGNSGFTVTLITEGKDVGYRNGVYYVADLGDDAATKFKMIRSTDFDQASTTEITQGAYFFVREGTINGSSSHVEKYAGFDTSGGLPTFTVGQTEISFGVFARSEQIIAGGGLTKVGSTVAVGAGDGIDVAADSIAVDVTDIIDTNYGLVENTNNIRVNIESDGGIEFDSVNKGLQIKPDVTTGATIAHIVVGANGIGLEVDNASIKHTAGSIHVNSDITTGVTIAPISSTINGIGVTVDNTSIGHTAGSIHVKPDITTGVTVAPITINANGVGVTVDNTSIGHTAGSIHVKPDTTTGATVAPLTINANGSGVTVDNTSIKHTAGSLHITPDSTTGAVIAPITIGANGVGVTVDNSTIEHTAGSIHIKADGIKDTHIDFGTGATQVSAVDIPILDAGTYTAQTEVEGAIQEIYGKFPNYLLTTGHRALDQLVHNVAETSYMEISRTGLQVDSVIYWETAAKLKKIREELYVYSGLNVTTITTNMYNAAGTVAETLIESLTRNVGGNVTSIANVLT